MKQCDISFIIPNYNCESLIPLCLDSIYRLGMDESRFEVIVIDDCSTDNSVNVIKEIAGCHSNLILLQQPENKRQGAARNRGLDIASGKYITFVDSDDLVGPDVVEALNEALEKNVDVYCGVSKDFCAGRPEDGKLFKIISDIPVNKVYTGYEFCSIVKDFSGNNGTPWGYFFRREFIEKYGRRLVEGCLFEETDWITFHFLKAETVFISSKLLYFYYHNPASVTMLDMSINYVVDSCALACRLMRQALEFRDTYPELFRSWNGFVDKNLLSRGIRLRFLMKYRPKDIRTYYRELAPEDLAFLREHYKGNRGREFFFRHRYISILILSVICSVRPVYRKIMRCGPERVNFYY